MREGEGRWIYNPEFLVFNKYELIIQFGIVVKPHITIEKKRNIVMDGFISMNTGPFFPYSLTIARSRYKLFEDDIYNIDRIANNHPSWIPIRRALSEVLGVEPIFFIYYD